MDACRRHGYNPLDSNNNTLITCSFDFEEDAFLTIEFAAANPHFHAFGQVDLIVPEINQLLVVSSRDCDKTLHLVFGNYDFFTAARARHVLQERNPFFGPL